MTEVTEVRARLSADTRPYEGAMQKAATSTKAVDKAVADVEARSAKAQVAMMAMGAAITYMGAKAVVALRGAVAAASDLNETTSKMQTIFGNASGEIERWAATSAKSFGMSKKSAYDAASTMALMGKAAGMTGKELADFSTKTVQAAADVRSFYNASSAEEVMYSMSSAMRGEYESMRRFNVLLDDMTLRQRALEMGIISTTKNALTPQQRVLAANAEIMEQLADAGVIGDFQRTADGLANSMQTLEAAQADAAAALGAELLPIAVMATKILTDLAMAFNDLPDGAKTFIAYLALALAGIAVLGPAVRVTTDLITAYKIAQLQSAAASVAMGTGAQVAATGGLAAMAAVLAKIVGIATLFVGAAIAVDSAMAKFDKGDTWWGKMLGLPGEGTPDSMGWLKDWVKGLGSSANEAATEVSEATAVTEAFNGALESLGISAADTAGELGAVANTAAQLPGPFAAATAAMQGLINAQMGLQAGRDNLLSMEDRFRASILGPASTGTAGGGARAQASDAESKALQRTIDKIREKDRAETDAEVKAAQRRAKARAEKRADAGARADVDKIGSDFIAIDQAAKRGEDIDGVPQGGTVGEATGSLTKAEQAKLDRQVEAIRARHKKATDAKVKALQDEAKAQREATGAAKEATQVYKDASTSLSASTDAGLRNRATMRTAVGEIMAIAEQEKQAALAGGASAEEAEQVWADSLLTLRDGLIDAATQAGFTRDDVMAFLKEIKLADKDFEVILRLKIDAASEAAVNAKLAKWGGKIKTMQDAESRADKLAEALTPKPQFPQPPGGVVTGPGTPPSWTYKTPATGRAGGGEIYGRGGPTSDSVPIWASPGEYMINAQQYAMNRDLVRAINSGTGRVSGGMTIGAVNVTEATPSGVRQNVIDALAESAYRQGAIR